MKYIYQIEHVYFLSDRFYQLFDCIYKSEHISLSNYLGLLPPQKLLVMVNNNTHILISNPDPYATLYLKETSTAGTTTSFILE